MHSCFWKDWFWYFIENVVQILPHWLISHCQFVYAVAQVSPYFLSVTLVFLQFLSFQVFFKHLFCVFSTINRVFDSNGFGFVFLSFISLHMSEQNILYHQKSTCKVDFMFFLILPWYFWCLRQNFCLSF